MHDPEHGGAPLPSTPGTTPEVSIIVPSVNGLPMIADCLAALEPQLRRVPAEVIVVDATDAPTRRHLSERFPWATLVPLEERIPIPQMRAVGLDRCRGRLVAVLEDHCIVCDDWLSVVVEAHEGPHCAVGGPVANGAVERLVDWAAFLCEYSHAMPPLLEGDADDVPGNNVAYDRSVEGELRRGWQDGLWEYFIHDRMRAAGERFLLLGRLEVQHRISFTFGSYAVQRFHFSRSFAAVRARQAGAARRLGWAALCLGLPPLLVARIAANVLGKRRHLRELLITSPLIFVFTLVWAAGELVGYLAGPGDSPRKVR